MGDLTPEQQLEQQLPAITALLKQVVAEQVGDLHTRIGGFEDKVHGRFVALEEVLVQLHRNHSQEAEKIMSTLQDLTAAQQAFAAQQATEDAAIQALVTANGQVVSDVGNLISVIDGLKSSTTGTTLSTEDQAALDAVVSALTDSTTDATNQSANVTAATTSAQGADSSAQAANPPPAPPASS